MPNGSELGIKGIDFPQWTLGSDSLITVHPGGNIWIDDFSATDLSTTGNGAFLNYTAGLGGGVSISDGYFARNYAENGADVYATSLPVEEFLPMGLGFLVVENSVFRESNAVDEACMMLFDVYRATTAGRADTHTPRLTGNVFSGDCETSQLAVDSGTALLQGNSMEVLNSAGTTLGAGEHENAELGLWAMMFLQDSEQDQLEAAAGDKTVTQDACNIGEGGTVNSLGYNLSTDDTCSLDHPTDLPNTDPMLGPPDERGIRIPLPGSPLIDHGPDEMVHIDGDIWPSLPCGWKDIYGLGRPQDGDGDGLFECDIGAVEVPGAGAIEAGHSGAFFNDLRNGEGQYVEILGGERAVIYTFTYRPDGTGPAWFIAIADIVGNSLVADEVLRPVGTSFGDGFDADDIWFAPAGGMSMVFGDCEATAMPGSVAYSGSPGLGYMPLLTRAKRLSHVAGCGQAVSPNAGLSGSFFDSGRNGEGVIVEWLPDGRVLVIFFTYDLQGNQMWIFGTGTPDGRKVTIEALYPTGFTTWGMGFDEGEVVLSSWGTFMLEWTDCDHLVFTYDATAGGYGSAVRNYRRLSRLAGTDCPAF